MELNEGLATLRGMLYEKTDGQALAELLLGMRTEVTDDVQVVIGYVCYNTATSAKTSTEALYIQRICYTILDPENAGNLNKLDELIRTQWSSARKVITRLNEGRSSDSQLTFDHTQQQCMAALLARNPLSKILEIQNPCLVLIPKGTRIENLAPLLAVDGEPAYINNSFLSSGLNPIMANTDTVIIIDATPELALQDQPTWIQEAHMQSNFPTLGQLANQEANNTTALNHFAMIAQRLMADPAYRCDQQHSTILTDPAGMNFVAHSNFFSGRFTLCSYSSVTAYHENRIRGSVMAELT